jgi:hypothetical protein
MMAAFMTPQSTNKQTNTLMNTLYTNKHEHWITMTKKAPIILILHENYLPDSPLHPFTEHTWNAKPTNLKKLII